MAEAERPQSVGTQAGCLAGSLTLVAGLTVSWGLAKFAVRQRPAHTEVNDALYWDFLQVQWCCGGNVVAVAAAGLVGVLVERWVRRTSASPKS